MREEAPREQQDRRAYISKGVHGGLRWLLSTFQGSWRGPIIGTLARRGETWGKTSFRDSKLFAIRAAWSCRQKPEGQVCVIARILHLE